MAITLTVGTNTYVSLEDADAYHTAYANTDWAGTDELKKQALVLATQSVDLLYGSKYLGILADQAQALLFPRQSFYDNDGRNISGIPTSLKNAVCELAMMQLNDIDIFPVASTATNVKDETLKVGGISISTTNYRSNEGETFDGFRKIDILLRPILKAATGSWRFKA